MSREPNRDEHDRRVEHDQELIGSLLQSLYETSTEEAQSLVSSGLARIEGDGVESSSTADSIERAGVQRRFTRPVLMILATAALILIVVSSSLFDQSNTAMAATAMAAVQKSLDQALLDVGRHYRVKSHIRLDDKTDINLRSDLYVKGGSRFAWRTGLGLVDGSIWLGSESGNAWVVPPVGPVIEGGNQNLDDWLARQLDFSNPYLHISTILQQMGDLYQLEFAPSDSTVGASGLEASDLEASGLENCQHIIGVLKNPPTNLAPIQVELWADAETGVARKVITSWNLSKDQTGWKSIAITLLDELVLPDDFFTANGHGGKERLRIRFNSGETQ